MAKSGILVSFTDTAPNYNERLAIRVRERSSCARHYQLVRGLKNPNYKKWDRKLQMFASTAKDDLIKLICSDL